MRGEDSSQGGRPAPPDEASGGFDLETERAEEEEPQDLVRRFRLVVTEGPDMGFIFLSQTKQVVLGTHPSADLVLRDRTVSRFHCRIEIREGAPTIHDLDSRNGTRVDGVTVHRAPLHDGALLTVGNTQLRFVAGDERLPLKVSRRERFGRLIGRALPMRAAFSALESAAACDLTVLLEGETGTGKELAAEAIHQESARSAGPFVVLDCGAVPTHLMASELSGHERGAFTGAESSHPGVLEAAHGGTLFLDEIGELELDQQPHLLRALERRQVKRVGGGRYTLVDVRVIAATNRDLRAEVNAGRFRADLFYRLAVITVRMPPLREHLEDIPLLVEDFLENASGGSRPQDAYLRTKSFHRRLSHHPWTGNVRELRNHLQRCVLAQRAGLPDPPPPDSSAPVGGSPVDVSRPFKISKELCTQRFERDYLEEILRRHEGNITAAARAAELNRTYFYRLLWRYGILS